MKRKPILWKQLQNNPPYRTKRVIGLLGTHHGVGVTFTGLMSAFYLGEECGLKTAFLECNTHHDMELIRNAYEWKQQEQEFSFHKITCFKEVTKERIPGILGQAYDCFLIDFGTDLQDCKEEFFRCSSNIIVAGRSEWDLIKLQQFYNKTQAFPGSDAWVYVIPQSKTAAVTKVQKKINRRIWGIPVADNPVLPDASSIRALKKIYSLS